MEFYNSPSAATQGYDYSMAAGITAAFKTLLETKHLYQNVTLDSKALKEQFMKRVEARARDTVAKSPLLVDPALVAWNLSVDQARVARSVISNESSFTFTPPDVKLYCSRVCNRREAFNLVSATLVSELEKRPRFTPPEEQYVLTYRCQSCKSTPDVFLVRRHAGKLQLTGRAPMEHVEVPAVIPKEIVNYYSGALMASQSGQSLAANFMLRTACEQWARRWAGAADKADAAIDKYMASLPTSFKEQFPSLKDIYSQLSVDIHEAKGSEELFGEMTEKLVEHFDARRLYKLVAPPAATQTA